MDNKTEPQEFDLDDILNEFHDLTGEAQEDAVPETIPELGPEIDVELDAELGAELEELLHLPELDIPPVTGGDSELDALDLQFPELEEPEIPAVEDEAEIAGEPALEGDTVRFTPITGEQLTEAAAEAVKNTVPEDPTIPIPSPEGSHKAPSAEPAFEVEEQFIPSPIVFTPRSRLKELKKKLVAGPEKLYYELSEAGVGRLQAAILANILIVLLCAGVTTLFVLGMVPENRLRLVIFSQVLAMLISALLGCQLMLDSIGAMFHGRFTLDTMLTLTFFACFVDAIFCLQELRVPCCAAFSLEVTMALWARYQRLTTEMAQLDTMRKAVRLHGIVKVENYYEGKSGLLRTEGEVEDFMDTYRKSTAPERVQNFYAILSLLTCIGISVFAGLRHGLSMGVQILSTSLLVAIPASFFVSLTRPMAILEQRLHMVGSVLCGWQGVKGLSSKAAFPLDDQDLFPQGCTKLNGVKFYGDRDPDEVVSFTTSLITVAGGGLVPVFQQLLKSRSGLEHPVENFQNYGGGGIGGEVCGEPVLLGSLNFLQDMGVEIPEGTMVNQAVYAAIDGQLCAVYAISYAKMRSAAAGLVTLCAYRRLTPVMLCCDFMLTEDFLRAKFNVKTRRIAFPNQNVRAELKRVRPDPEATVLALTTREELVSSAYAVTGAKALRTSSKLGVIIHLLGGILGLIIMLVLAILGNTELLTPTNILLYQLIWAIPGLLVTEWTRTV
ncbi:MAG: hypothetical protein ACI4PH_11450 [Faecousia sp.]